jgi:holliday junction DNA helicase RuvA
MIAQLRGRVLAIGGTWLVVDLSGLGLRVLCAPATAGAARIGESVDLHTSLVVREDSLTLYGFSTGDERDIFELVQTASGIGPRIALAIVSVFEPGEFAAAITSGNTAAITRVPGIGAKGAAKLVLELKDKVAIFVGSGALSVKPSTAVGDWREQVIGGLEGLGYSHRDAEAACDRVAADLGEDADVSVAQLLRAALRSLAK